MLKTYIKWHQIWFMMIYICFYSCCLSGRSDIEMPLRGKWPQRHICFHTSQDDGIEWKKTVPCWYGYISHESGWQHPRHQGEGDTVTPVWNKSGKNFYGWCDTGTMTLVLRCNLYIYHVEEIPNHKYGSRSRSRTALSF